MKKRRLVPTTYTAASKPVEKQPAEKPKNPKANKVLDDDDEENSGFGKWLRTGEGVEFMKYFVLLNSIGVFLAMGWPSISKCFQIIKSFFVDDEEVM